MILFPNAKINLGLYVESKRPDGYHNISTVFYPIPLCDVVEVATSGTVALQCFGNRVDCEPEKNLVMKAYRLLEREFGLPPVEICLYKHIPDGAGLGGGSSDAVAVLKALNALFGLNVANAELAEYAAKLGADCPFFVYNQPMAARGTGNEFSDVAVDLSGYVMVLVKPDVSVPTAAAYSDVVPRVPETPVEHLVARPIEEWKHTLSNDFERSVFLRYPQLQRIKDGMYASGALYASMSGSGSAMYAIFENDIMADSFVSICRDGKLFKFSL